MPPQQRREYDSDDDYSSLILAPVLPVYDEEEDVRTVYNESVLLVLDVRNEERARVMMPEFHNWFIEGDLTFNVSTYLHKRTPCAYTPATTLESSMTDLVISRGASSVRFGECAHMTDTNAVTVNTADSGTNLRLRYAQETHSLAVYKNDEDTVWVWILASNFLTVSETEPEDKSTEREGYVPISLDEHGNLNDIHVKGSIFIDTHIRVKECETAIGAWYHGAHSSEWYQPNAQVCIPDLKPMFAQALEPDLVVSRGNASVLIRPTGEVFANGSVCVIGLPKFGTVVSRTIVVFN